VGRQAGQEQAPAAGPKEPTSQNQMEPVRRGRGTDGHTHCFVSEYGNLQLED